LHVGKDPRGILCGLGVLRRRAGLRAARRVAVGRGAPLLARPRCRDGRGSVVEPGCGLRAGDTARAGERVGGRRPLRGLIRSAHLRFGGALAYRRVVGAVHVLLRRTARRRRRGASGAGARYRGSSSPEPRNASARHALSNASGLSPRAPFSGGRAGIVLYTVSARSMSPPGAKKPTTNAASSALARSPGRGSRKTLLPNSPTSSMMRS
jgi:hypothetical protein